MADNKITAKIEELLKFGSFLYVLLVASGLAFNFYYFKQFGINITGYIDFTEALVLFLPMMVDVLVIPLAYFLIWYRVINKSIFQLDETARRPRLFGSKKDMIQGIAGLFWIFIAGTIIVYVISLFKPGWTGAFYTSLVLDICFFGPFWFELLLEKIHFPLDPIYRYGFYTIIITMCFVVLRAHSKADQVKHKRDFQYFELVHNDSQLSIRNDSSLQLLGRTKNYIFIYNFRSHSTSVYQVSELKKFTLWEEGAKPNSILTNSGSKLKNSVPVTKPSSDSAEKMRVITDSIKK